MCLSPSFFLEFRENPTSHYAGSLSFEFLPVEKSQSRDLKMSSTTLHGPEHPWAIRNIQESELCETSLKRLFHVPHLDGFLFSKMGSNSSELIAPWMKRTEKSKKTIACYNVWWCLYASFASSNAAVFSLNCHFAKLLSKRFGKECPCT